MSDSETKHGEKKLVTIKNAADLQRLKIEKLMKNPDKPVVIPERPKQKALAAPPDFVRNVMGSSAGAGSGEFHVYRHLRRKEYARQKFIQEKSEKEKLDEEYHSQIEENKRAAEEKTAKKRAKRLRKKRNAKLKSKIPKTHSQQTISSQSDSSSEDDKNQNYDKIKEDAPEDSLCDSNSKIDEENQTHVNQSGDDNKQSKNESKNDLDQSNVSNNKCTENITLTKEQNESNIDSS